MALEEKEIKSQILPSVTDMTTEGRIWNMQIEAYGRTFAES